MKTVAAGLSVLDVKSFGAVGDGKSAAADTAGFAAALKACGPTGRIYFPAGHYNVDGSKISFPTAGYSGWLSIELDGTINLSAPLTPKRNTAIIGLSGDPQGVGGSFVYDRYASIMVPKGAGSFPCIDMAGTSQCVLRGLNLLSDTGPAVHIHDDNGTGCTWNKFESCVIGCGQNTSSPFVIDASPGGGTGFGQNNAGFGLILRELSLQTNGLPVISLKNFPGYVTIRDSYFGGNGMYLENSQVPQITGIVLDNILTEGFINNGAVLTSRGPWITNITMRQVHMADNQGVAYLIDALPQGSPESFTVAGVTLEGCDGYTAIINPAGGLFCVSGMHGYDKNGGVI